MVRISPMFKKVASFIFTKPATSGYPFKKPELAGDYRGQLQLDLKICIGCGLCRKDCPGGAIEMVEFFGKKRPQFNLSKCIFCYQCAESCPKKAIHNSTVYELATTAKETLVMKPKHVIVCQA